MAIVSLVRIDCRLLHGQVVTKWIQESKSNRVVIIDNKLMNDEFLKNVFLMAAPPGINVEIKSSDKAAKEWNENQFGEGRILVLFKDPQNVSDCIKSGFPIEHLQVANIGSAPGKKMVYKTVSLSKEEANLLKSISDQGTNVYFQSLPEDRKVDLQSILRKKYKNLL